MCGRLRSPTIEGGPRAILALLLSVNATARASVAQCPDGSPPPCGRAAHAPVPHNVAVLYFDNLSRDSNDVYLADGLAEEIISRLGHVGRLTVKSGTAVRRFRGHVDQDPTVLGRALGVEHLVSGSVQRAGARLRVRVELVKAAAGTHVWGETYDRTEGDVLAIEDDIAQAVAGEVIGRLAPTERAVLATRPTRNAEAYDHYLKGNFYLSRRTSEADGRRALEEYQAALRLDARFAAAHGRLGLVYGIYASWPWDYPGLTHDSLVALGLAAASRATALDSASVDGWLARGFLLIPVPSDPDVWHGFRLAPGLLTTGHTCPPTIPRCARLALSALERALRSDSRNAEVWYQYGRALLVAGDFAAADSAIRRSLTLDPDRSVSAWLLGWTRLLERRFGDAKQLLDSAIALGRHDVSVYSLRTAADLALGDGPGSRADLDTIGRLLRTSLVSDSVASVFYTALRVVVDARLGDSAAARARLDTLVRQHSLAGIRLPTMLICFAASQVAVGEFDQGLALLERVPLSPGVWYGLQHPFWDAVRQHPRFQRIETESRALQAALAGEDR